MPCHHAGYDRHDKYTHPMKERKQKTRNENKTETKKKPNRKKRKNKLKKGKLLCLHAGEGVERANETAPTTASRQRREIRTQRARLRQKPREKTKYHGNCQTEAQRRRVERTDTNNGAIRHSISVA